MKRVFPKGTPPEQVIKALTSVITALDRGKSWSIEIVEWRKPRTQQQNAYLWGVVYPSILEAGGEVLAGWQRDDLHEYYLGECFGWEMLEGFGRKRMRPLKRSSALNKQEFTDYLEFISQRCAELGIVIPEPEMK